MFSATGREIITRILPLIGPGGPTRWEELFDWERPQAGCVCFPRYRGADGVEAFCHALVERAGVVLLPSSMYASGLGAVPADRFRIGVGRAHPEPALAALGAFLGAPGR